MEIPKVQLDLDGMIDEDGALASLVDAAVADGVEDEKCVVGQYRTSKQQKQEFVQLLETCDRDRIPIEWVIDIADESNGWFYGTAYHYDDNTQLLHVMVPDKLNPTFDGHVQLDHRTVHLIECVDGKSAALFNKITRDSVVKVKWDVEWFEEETNEFGQPVSVAGETPIGNWIFSTARYYIRIANQLLVEDRDTENNGEDNHTKGYVIITADMNVRLLYCHKNRGIEDFARLVNEGTVSYTDEALECANASPANTSSANLLNTAEDIPATSSSNAANNQSSNRLFESRSGKEGDKEKDKEKDGGDLKSYSLRKLTEVSHDIKESLVDILEEFDRKKEEEKEIASIFQEFALDGDLDQGLHLMDYFNRIAAKKENSGNNADDEDDQDIKITRIIEDTRHNASKLEKQLLKLMKNGYELAPGGVTSATSSPTKNRSEEYELLKKEYKKLKKEYESKEQELRSLRKDRR